MAIELIQQEVKDFQARRKEVSDDFLRQFMTPRKLEWKGNPNPKPKEATKKEKETSSQKN
jgi:tryptophanyl-tRNA synthetase